MIRLLGLSTAFLALGVFAGSSMADAPDIGAMAAVERTVYGVPPQGSQLVKRRGDAVVFQEAIETMDSSGALIRFVDDSTLTLGEKAKVLIDSFVFDPGTAEGEALIRLSVGTLRYVTGDMPKGKTVIKTPTATLVLRGTDVVVHVHPDGTTDTVVNEGAVDARNDVTNDQTRLMPGLGATLGPGGNRNFSGPAGPAGPSLGGREPASPPEHRRAKEPPSPNHSDGGSGGPGPGN